MVYIKSAKYGLSYGCKTFCSDEHTLSGSVLGMAPHCESQRIVATHCQPLPTTAYHCQPLRAFICLFSLTTDSLESVVFRPQRQY